jgi:hypothetical protein
MSIKDQNLNQNLNQNQPPSAETPENPETTTDGTTSSTKPTTTEEAPGARQIVQVTYFSDSTGKASGRAYAYYGYPGEVLLIGDTIMVPLAIRGALDPNETRLQKAKVVDNAVPPENIEAFKDKVRTVASRKERADQDIKELWGPPPATEISDGATEEHPAVPDWEPSDDIFNTPAEEPPAPEPEPVAEIVPEPEPEPAVERIILGAGDQSTAIMVKAYPERDATFQQLSGQITDLIARLNAAEVKTDDDAKRAADDLSMVARLKSAMTKRREDYTKPLQALKTEFIATFNAVMDPLEEANKGLKAKLGTYAMVKKAAAEEERKAAAIAEVARMAQAATDEATGEIQDPPAAPEPPAPAPTPTTRGAIGVVNTTMVPKFDILNADMVPREFCSPDEKLIRAAVNAGTVKIAGCRIWEEPSTTVKV